MAKKPGDSYSPPTELLPVDLNDIRDRVIKLFYTRPGGRNWAQQTAFLQSEEGAAYLTELDKALKAHVQSL